MSLNKTLVVPLKFSYTLPDVPPNPFALGDVSLPTAEEDRVLFAWLPGALVKGLRACIWSGGNENAFEFEKPPYPGLGIMVPLLSSFSSVPFLPRGGKSSTLVV